MKKALLTLMCIAAMMAAGTSLKAQEVTIVLTPGWNWISHPSTDTVDFATAFGSFTPATGDVIKSRWGQAFYTNNRWMGSISQFYPGYGYMYKSNRTMPILVTFNVQQPTPQVMVTTSEPTDITQNSATCGGNVASTSGDYVFVFLKGICWSTNPNPTFNDNYIEAGNGLGSFTVSMTELTPGTTYYVRAFAVTPTGTFYGEEEIFTTDHEFVDLGLPSDTLWATINVGANAPEEYGDYFAWGEISPKDYYDWSNYLHSINNGSTLIKYVYPSSYVQYQIIDSLTVLMPEDDAATANWGEDWRMPTKEEWQELYQSTSHEWTTQDGVNGMLFTAQNGNSIFLPAAGTYSQSGLNYEGDQGMYWSSNLVTDFVSSLAWCFRFMTDDYAMIYGQRQNGYPVRPVRPGVLNPSFNIDATANPAEGGVVSGGGSYFEGTECTLTATANEGYAFTNWTENDEVVSADATYTFTVNADRTLVANFTYNGGNAPTGAINGKFTINSNGDQVYFSQGNLQYQASTNTWKFAENQWDYVGEDNANISQTYDGWIDLFGWGTSGYNHGANCYQPWNTSETNSDYYAYGSYTYNLYDQTGQADWGYNPISNGGNTINQWRTLTQPEWNYVFHMRTTTSDIRYAKANVNNVNGVILLPDDWSSSTYSLNNTNISNASFSSNTLTASQWNALEQAGAVFMPAAGYRSGTSVSYVGSGSNYWSASCSGSDGAYPYRVYFNDHSLYTGYYVNGRYYGFSVRVVCTAEN